MSIAFAGLCALASSAWGQVVFSTSTTAPATNVVSSYSIADSPAPSGYAWRNDTTNGRRDLGEVFFPAANLDLEKITLQLQSGSGSGTKNAPFTLTIYRFSSLAPVTVAETLGSFTGTIPNVVYTANTYLTFDISAASVKLNSGSTYGFLLSFDSAAASRSMSFQFTNTANATPFGQRLESSNGTTFGLSSTSLEFYIQASPSAVPEPANAAFAGGFVVLAAGVMGRRRNSKL